MRATEPSASATVNRGFMFRKAATSPRGQSRSIRATRAEVFSASDAARLMAIVVAHRPIRRRAGMTMLLCVAGFGVFTIAFGISRNLIVSMVALLLVGASDMVSVIIRGTLVQITTPPEMRGRVSAVNLLFIGASNELGEFESGVVARVLGPVGAVAFGGVGATAVTAVWAWLFPRLRTADRLV